MKKTNRTFKRFAAITSASLLAACAMAPVFTSMTSYAATGDNSITINPGAGDTLTHTGFEAYQVFSGTYNDDGLNLTVKNWGDGIKVSDFIDAITSDEILKVYFTGTYTDDAASAVAVSDIVADFDDDSEEAKAFAKLAVANKSTKSGKCSDSVITELADGYYVITDASAATDGEGKSTWSLGMLEVAGGSNVTVNTKIGLPTVVKKVKEDDVKTDGGYGEGFNDVADWDTNTDIPFKIIASMPSNIAEYDHYYLKFTDTYAANLSNPYDIVVTIGNEEITDDDYVLSINDNTMTLEILDILKYNDEITADTVVTIEYNAKLKADGDSKAVIGTDGQENKVMMEYSNNPNITGNGSSHPGEGNTGETPEDKVIVFTYAVDITKQDGVTKEKLENATFKLSNSEKDGLYAKVNADGYFEGWDATGSTLKTDANGNFKIYGLDDGTYYLYEQDWSTEYNIPDKPFTVIITADTLFTQDSYANATAALKGFTGSVNNVTDTAATAENGTISGIIENNKGTQLPSTGGIGTTIFYLGGGAMAAIGGVYLISKRRMKKSEE